MTIKDLENCIEEYGDDIYSFCLHLTLNKELAEDLYQDTFLTAVEKVESIDGLGSVKNYLLGICTNIWKNRKRKWAWRNRIAPSTELFEGGNDEAAYEDEDKVLEKESSKILRIAIDNLSEKYKTIVLLFYMEELSYEEIAKIVHIPVGTVKSRLSSAKKKLRLEVEEYFDE